MKKLLLLSALFWATCANASLVDVNAEYTGWYNDLGILRNQITAIS